MLSTMICALILIAVFFAGMLFGMYGIIRDVARGNEKTLKTIADYKRRCGEC